MTELGETLWAIADQLRRLRREKGGSTPQTHKKGLMQQVFPSMAEAEG